MMKPSTAKANSIDYRLCVTHFTHIISSLRKVGKLWIKES